MSVVPKLSIITGGTDRRLGLGLMAEVKRLRVGLSTVFKLYNIVHTEKTHLLHVITDLVIDL